MCSSDLVNLVRVDGARGSTVLSPLAPALALPEAAGLRTRLLESRSPSPWSEDPEQPLALERLGAGPVLLQLFVRGNPFRASAGSAEPWPQVLHQLQAAGRLAGLAVLGSPYLWEALRPLLQAGIPAGYSPGQMPQAQRLLLESLGFGSGADSAANAADDFTD